MGNVEKFDEGIKERQREIAGTPSQRRENDDRMPYMDKFNSSQIKSIFDRVLELESAYSYLECIAAQIEELSSFSGVSCFFVFFLSLGKQSDLMKA